MYRKSCIGCGAFAFFGLIVIVGAITQYFVLKHLLDKVIHDTLVVDSKDSKGYDDWVTNDKHDAVPLLMVYHLWNLTNVDGVLQGEKPQYDELGPYTYRRFRRKLDISFPRNRKEASYTEYTWYHFLPEESNGTLEDRVTSFNSAYFGLVFRAGGETKLLLSFVGPTLANIMKDLTGTFVAAVISGATPIFLSLEQATVLNGLANQTNPQAIFYATWANATSNATAPPGWPNDLYVSTAASGPSEISVESAISLWNATFPLSLTNQEETSSGAWSLAAQGDATIQARLREAFSLSAEQLTQLLAWRSSYMTTSTTPLLLQTFAPYGVKEPADLGWLQWGMANVNPAGSIQRSAGLPGPPEVAAWTKNAMQFNVSSAKAILNGTYGLMDTKNVIAFFTLPDSVTVKERWGLNMTEYQILFDYLFNDIASLFVNGLIQQVSSPAPDGLGGSGLFVTRTADDWIFNGHDPLVDFVLQQTTGDPTATASAAIQVNMTSEEDARKLQDTRVQLTGKGDLTDVEWYVAWHGYRDYLPMVGGAEPGFWAVPEPIGGTAGYHFGKGIEKTAVYAWVSEVLRIVELKYEGKESIRGIDVYRYRINPRLLDPDPDYFQDFIGFANLSSSRGGVPVFLSKPNMLDADMKWLDRVGGMNPNPEEDDTYIDAEPILGITLRGHKRLQPNIYITPETVAKYLDFYNRNVASDLMYPLLTGDETATITKSKADEYKKFLAFYDFVHKWLAIILWIGVAFGTLTLLSGTALTVYFARKDPYYERLT